MQWRREERLVDTVGKGNAMSGTERLPAGSTVLVGLVGRGIQKSRSPAMHEAEGTAQGLDYVYRLFDTELMPPQMTLDEILRCAEISDFAGLNITYPAKVEIIAHLDDLSEAARMVGAVNTVVFRDGKRRGHNTDLWGFAESFRRNMGDVARDNVLLIGAGGAGAAVAHALCDCRAGTLWIADADADRAGALARKVCDSHGAGTAYPVENIADAAALSDGLVNATPVGMAHMPGMPIAQELIRPEMWVADIIYFPLETELLRTARNRGCRTLSGAGMAVFQAVRAFELFTGLKPDVARMEAAFRALDHTAPD